MNYFDRLKEIPFKVGFAKYKSVALHLVIPGLLLYFAGSWTKSETNTKEFNESKHDYETFYEQEKVNYGQSKEYLQETVVQYQRDTKKEIDEYKKMVLALKSEVESLKGKVPHESDNVSTNISGIQKYAKNVYDRLAPKAKKKRSNLPSKKTRKRTSQLNKVHVASKSLVFETELSSRDDFIKIPAGSNIKGTLLTGGSVAQIGYAKKGLRTPFLIQLDYAMNLANQHYLVDLIGCYALAKGESNMSSGRVEVIANKIVCIDNHDLIVEKDLSAFVVGKNDMFGLEGSLDDFNETRAISKAFLASSIETMANVFQTKAAAPLQGGALGTASIGTLAVGTGTATGLNKLAEWFVGQLNEIKPQIKISPGQKVKIVLTSGIEFPKKYFKGNSSKNRSNYARVW